MSACTSVAIVRCTNGPHDDGPHTFDPNAVMSETMPRNLAEPFVPTHPTASRAAQAAAELAAEDRAARDAGPADTVGVIDRLGYLYCHPCADLIGAQADITVWRDTSPHNAEPCDRCGRMILTACRPADYPPYPTTEERGAAARRAATPSPDTCANDDHEPDPDGTHCLRCGIIAEPVGPAELAEHLTAGYAEAVEAIRDRAQLARIGGRAILRYYSVTTRPYRPWTVALHSSHDNALDGPDAEHQRRMRADRDASHDLVRPHWPIMRAAAELTR